jgi:hypothetical protein
MDINEITAAIRQAHRPECTVELCLAGDLQAEWEMLERQRLAVQRSTADSLEGGAGQDIAQRQDALRDRMAAAMVTARLRAMPRAEHTRLLAAHPPRRDADGQLFPTDVRNYNAETYFPALIRASWVEPALDADTLTHLLDEVLSQGQFDELAAAALTVNRAGVRLPNSRAASTTTPSSGGE